MDSSSLTIKGQVTIPVEVRKRLGLQPGDRVGFVIENNQVILLKKESNIEAAFGICRPKKSVDLEGIEQAIRHRGRKGSDDEGG